MENMSNGLAAGDICFSKAGLANGTTKTLTIANAVTYAVRGRLYVKAAASNTAVPTEDTGTTKAFRPIAANQFGTFAIVLNAAGNVGVVQGEVAATGETARYPILPDRWTPIGTAIVRADTTAVGSWVYGVNNFTSVTGVTVTYEDVMALPDHAAT